MSSAGLVINAPGTAAALSYHALRKVTVVTPPLAAESRQVLSRTLGEPSPGARIARVLLADHGIVDTAFRPSEMSTVWHALGVSERVVGLTVVSVAPPCELSVSLAAALRKRRR